MQPGIGLARPLTRLNWADLLPIAQSGSGTISCALPCLHLQDEHLLTRALNREQRQLSMLRTQLGQMLFKMDNLPVSLSTVICQCGCPCCTYLWVRC